MESRIKEIRRGIPPTYGNYPLVEGTPLFGKHGNGNFQRRGINGTWIDLTKEYYLLQIGLELTTNLELQVKTFWGGDGRQECCFILDPVSAPLSAFDDRGFLKRGN